LRLSRRLPTFFLAYLVRIAAFSASDYEAISSASPPSAGAEALVALPVAVVELETGEDGIVPFPAPAPPVAGAAGAAGGDAVGAVAAGVGKAYGGV
jgi:hypothetical protein